MTPNLASRAPVLPSWFVLACTAFGTMLVVVATLLQARLDLSRGEPTNCYFGPPSPEELQERAEHRPFEQAVEAKRPELEACMGTARFFLGITHEIENGRVFAVHTEDNWATAAKAAATSRCFRRVLDQVEFPSIARPLRVTTWLSLTGDTLDIDPRVGELAPHSWPDRR